MRTWSCRSSGRSTRLTSWRRGSRGRSSTRSASTASWCSTPTRVTACTARCATSRTAPCGASRSTGGPISRWRRRCSPTCRDDARRHAGRGGAARSAAMTADDMLAAVRERARTNRFWAHLGVEVADAREGWVRLSVRVRDEICNAAGAPVHGGVYSALVDMAVGGALSTIHEASAGGVGQTTLDLNVSFISGTSGSEVFAEGRILRRGRSIAFGEATITDGQGKLVAVGRATYMILAAT